MGLFMDASVAVQPWGVAVCLAVASQWLWDCPCVCACVVGGTLVSGHSWAFLAITCSQSEAMVPPLSTAVGSQLLSCGPCTGPACCSSWGLASSQPPQSGRGGVTRVRVCGMRSLWEGGGAPPLSETAWVQALAQPLPSFVTSGQPPNFPASVSPSVVGVMKPARSAEGCT